jgi:two-component system, LytTR family, response regulator AlgR
MKVLIVDDEPLARSRLKRLLANLDGYDCIAEADNGNAAMQVLAQQEIDIVLLDIQMPGQTGLEFAAALLKHPLPPAVILVTAHPEHALEAYAVAPADYVVKPVSQQRLQQALQRVGSRTRAHIAAPVPDKISYQLAGVTRQVALSRVSYFVADDKYVRMVFDGGEALLEQSLQQLEQQFPLLLQRIHRHTLVNWLRFDCLRLGADGKYTIKLRGCEALLDVSRREAARLKQLIATGY